MLISPLLTAEHGFYNAAESVLMNPVVLNQVHGFKIITLTKQSTETYDADGWVTNVPGVMLTIKTADCAPILLQDGPVIGAIHAGWKGALVGVIEQGLLAMVRLGAQLENIKAAVGPCIHQKSNQFGEDVKAFFPPETHHFFDSENRFDLPGFVVDRLMQAGITQIDLKNVDTYFDSSYNSFRRDRTPCRQYSQIQLKG